MRFCKTMAAASALAPLLFVAATPGHAASDGTLGATSTGSFNVSLSIEAAPTGVQVFALDDVAFAPVAIPTDPAGVPISEIEYFCLRRSDAGSIRVIFPGAHSLSNGNGGEIPFTPHLLTPQGVQLENNGQGQFTTSPSEAGCGSSSGAGIAHAVKLDATVMPDNPAGSYSGIVILYVSPL